MASVSSGGSRSRERRSDRGKREGTHLDDEVVHLVRHGALDDVRERIDAVEEAPEAEELVVPNGDACRFVGPVSDGFFCEQRERERGRETHRRR